MAYMDYIDPDVLWKSLLNLITHSLCPKRVINLSLTLLNTAAYNKIDHT